jgi:hypothetical protein
MAARGGKRPNSGRKSNAEKLLETGFVASWFTAQFQEIKWKELVNFPSQTGLSVGALIRLFTSRVHVHKVPLYKAAYWFTLKLDIQGSPPFG